MQNRATSHSTPPEPNRPAFTFTLGRSEIGDEYYVAVTHPSGTGHVWVPSPQAVDVTPRVRKLLAEAELQKLAQFTQWLQLTILDDDGGGGSPRPNEPPTPTLPPATGGPTDGETQEGQAALDRGFWERLEQHLREQPASSPAP